MSQRSLVLMILISFIVVIGVSGGMKNPADESFVAPGQSTECLSDIQSSIYQAIREPIDSIECSREGDVKVTLSEGHTNSSRERLASQTFVNLQNWELTPRTLILQDDSGWTLHHLYGRHSEENQR